MNQIQIKKNDEMVYGSFTLTPTGLNIVGMPPFEEWLKCGDFIQRANKSVHFWIGDWLNYGEGVYGETYAQAMDETKFKYDTLVGDKWVAKRIENLRRRSNLSFSHHKEVAELEPEEQDALLDKAEEEKMDSKQFRKFVQHYKLVQDLPELSEEELAKEASPDFEVVQVVVDASLNMREALEKLAMDTLDKDARDYLLSELRKVVGELGSFLLRWDEKKVK